MSRMALSPDGNRLATVNVANGGAWQIRNTSSYSIKNHLLIFEVAFSNLALELVAVDLFKAQQNQTRDTIIASRLSQLDHLLDALVE